MQVHNIKMFGHVCEWIHEHILEIYIGALKLLLYSWFTVFEALHSHESETQAQA